MKTLSFIGCILLFTCTASFAGTPDWAAVENILGRKGAAQAGMLKVSFPRSDLKVKVGKASIEPGLALTSWVAFHQEETGTVIMGDLVLLEDEVGPVMAKLVSGGVWVTAVHNHLLGESPKVMYVHFGGRGEPAKVAQAYMDALRLTKTPLKSPAQAEEPSARAGAAWDEVEGALGLKGRRTGNILSFSIPRRAPVSEMGVEIPPFMGVATAVNFEWDNGKAAAAGDFVLTAEEVNPVVSALMDGGLSVTALHNHMLFESPRLFFLHFWGYGEPAMLAKGLKNALGKTAVKAE